MKTVRTLLLLGLLFSREVRAHNAESDSQGNLLDFVNILQGTDSRPELSRGNTLPLLGMPWGMMNWSIENARGPWFFHPDGKIDGFRATHQPSPWISDYGQFVLMPQVGDVQMDREARMTEYDTNASILRPDYEKLLLDEGHITAELTASERCAVFRFNFGESPKGRVILNTYGESEISLDGQTIRGFSRANSGGVSTNFASYFVIQLDRDPSGSQLFVAGKPVHDRSAKGENVSGFVEFSTKTDEPVELKVGTSLISWEQAQQNLKQETADGFDATRSRVKQTWEANLGRIAIEAGDDQKKTFYSCLYHAQMFPHRLYELDASGKPTHYSPYDGQIHPGVLYGDIGIWDAFRTTFPFITIVYPEQLSEILQGFVNASKEGGTLPEWPSPGYRDCMIGQHCAAIFADAAVKGINGFDLSAAYQSLRKSAFEPPSQGTLVRRGLADYMKLGYIPDGASTYCVSATLDYAYDDWCVAQIARQLGQIDDCKTLTDRAQNYRHVWDSSVGFMHSKDREGRWIEPFDQFAWGGPYAEAGPWQASWFVPHDPEGLAGLLGGPEKMADKLDQMMGIPPIFHVGGYGQVIHEMREMAITKFGQYDQGNQPGFNLLYLYTGLGQPWKTEYWTRRVCAELFDSTEKGFPGDEDNGSMSSWYLLSSMGLYSVCPGTPDYVLTSPLFADITLHLPNDKKFEIIAEDNNARHLYVQSRFLNGAEDHGSSIAYKDIMQGGELRVKIGLDANMRRASKDPAH